MFILFSLNYPQLVIRFGRMKRKNTDICTDIFHKFLINLFLILMNQSTTQNCLRI